jgi:hypothetical protein
MDDDWVIVEQFHRTVSAPRRLPAGAFKAIRRALTRGRFRARLRRAARRVCRRHPPLAGVRVDLSW